MSRKIKVVGLSFDHMHMGDLLRMCHEHPEVEIVGIADPEPAAMAAAISRFSIGSDAVFADYVECAEKTRPDLAIICSATGKHADYAENIAPYVGAMLVEKPFASSLADADRIIAAASKHGCRLLVNWPLAWYPCHRTAHRLIMEGVIGDVWQVHYYDGNRGPLRHIAGKEEVSAAEAEKLKSESWWYQKATGGGSLNDYLGYGVTLGTWFHGGKAPVEVTCVAYVPTGMEVDEHTITVARYDTGLSKFETRWGTFTDPWTLQPQPKCGFVIVGSEGTISSYDYEPTITLQTRSNPTAHPVPVDESKPPYENVIQYYTYVVLNDKTITGPISPEISRIGQQIVETASLSAIQNKTLPLIQ